MHESRDRCLEVVLVNDFSRLFIPDLNLAVLPACDELGYAIVVQVEGRYAVHSIFGLPPPSSREPVVDAHSPMHQRVRKARLVERLQADHHISLRDLFQHILMAEDAHLEILGTANQLSNAIVVDVTECEGTDVVTSHSPEQLVALVVEGLYRAVAAHHTSRELGGCNVAESNDVHAIMDLFEEQVSILLDVVDHERRLGPDHEDIMLQVRVQCPCSNRRDFPVDVQKHHLILRILPAVMRTMDQHLASSGASREARVLAIVSPHANEALEDLVPQGELKSRNHACRQSFPLRAAVPPSGRAANTTCSKWPRHLSRRTRR
mmetsp:Transcript_55833/g.120704  ORF Transcript_55833/g.120704 Transcript_55833/m.120704 type:complete len:320 (-) Transcript_55833:66-1025(-)